MIAFITSRPLELLAQYFNDDGHKYKARHVIVTREFLGNNLSFPKTLVIGKQWRIWSTFLWLFPVSSVWKITQRFRRISFVVSHVISMDTCYGLQCFCNYYIDEKKSKHEQAWAKYWKISYPVWTGPSCNQQPPPEDVCTAHSNLGSPSAETPFSGDHWLHQIKT